MPRPWNLVRPVLLALIGLECVLQLGSLAVHWSYSAPEPARSESGLPHVLCVGDSYTYGLGASDPTHSYPAALQRALGANGGSAAEVVNAGYPGQNSRELLERLEAQLTRTKPGVVCVLVGLNDGWSRPERWSGETGGWRVRFRTWRMLEVLFGGEYAAPEGVDASTGEFRAGDAKRGTGSGPADPSGVESGSQPAKPATPQFDAALARITDGDARAAIPLFRASIATEPSVVAQSYQGIVQAHTILGEREQAQAAFGWLTREWRERPTAAVAEALAGALITSGQRGAAAELAAAALGRFADSSNLWWIVGKDHYESGRLREAETHFDRAVALAAAGSDSQWCAATLRDLARACGARAPRKAVESLLRALSHDGDVARARTVVTGLQGKIPEDVVKECIRSGRLGVEEQRLARELFAEQWGDESEAYAHLEAHLRDAAALCAAHGAQTVFLMYPFDAPAIAAAQRKAAEATGSELVSMRAAFTNALREHRREDLFIADGHCTDAGYGLMGRTAAPAVRRALAR